MPTYTNSPMVQVVKLAPNYYHGRITSDNPTGKIDKITIHHMAGVLTAERCGEVFQTAEASTNYNPLTCGEQCNVVCKEKKCDLYTGECIECEGTRWGNMCQYKCSSKCVSRFLKAYCRAARFPFLTC